MKTIYNKSNGIPDLISGEIGYDEKLFTEIEPSNSLYYPIYFNGEKWVGTPYEEWLRKLPKPEPIEAQPIEKVAANMQMQLMKANISQLQLQKQNAQMMMEITKLKGGN